MSRVSSQSSRRWIRVVLGALALAGLICTGLCGGAVLTGPSIPDTAEPVFALGGSVIASGLLDGSGEASFGLVIPNFVWLANTPLMAQAASGLQFPLRASAVAGGIVR